MYIRVYMFISHRTRAVLNPMHCRCTINSAFCAVLTSEMSQRPAPRPPSWRKDTGGWGVRLGYIMMMNSLKTSQLE